MYKYLRVRLEKLLLKQNGSYGYDISQKMNVVGYMLTWAFVVGQNRVRVAAAFLIDKNLAFKLVLKKFIINLKALF